MFPNHIRDKGVAITNAVLALADLVYLQVTALAFANIGYRYFLVRGIVKLIIYAGKTDCICTGLHMYQCGRLRHPVVHFT